jgi:hypothetical protein
MILCIHSDAGYCIKKNRQSREAIKIFLSNNNQCPPNKGVILMNEIIIKTVMSSAAEAELGALFLNAKEAIYLCQKLTEMGHQQPRTPIQTDNTTSDGVINNKIQMKRTNAMNMRFHWLRNQEAQGQFKNLLATGADKSSNYFTKHHPPAHHVNSEVSFSLE